jgi:ATP-binding cassette subfamily F protein uup
VTVQSFLGRFAFPREAFFQRVSGLSGGERARLLLARLLLKKATLLFLDEPTNDLDLDTLRVLEDALLGFDGAVLVVTHDRAFLDRVCTGVLTLDGAGSAMLYASRQQAEAAEAAKKQAQRNAPKASATAPTRSRPPKASWAEKQEHAALPGKIEETEQRAEALEAQLADPATYTDPSIDHRALSARLESVTAEIEGLYARWEELEERVEG